jgi:GTP-binding protein EngB required for normal cell division
LAATKADRVSKNQLHTSVQKLSDTLEVATRQIIPFSAKARIGQDELWRAIKRAAGVEDPDAGDMAKTG